MRVSDVNIKHYSPQHPSLIVKGLKQSVTMDQKVSLHNLNLEEGKLTTSLLLSQWFFSCLWVAYVSARKTFIPLFYLWWINPSLLKGGWRCQHYVLNSVYGLSCEVNKQWTESADSSREIVMTTPTTCSLCSCSLWALLNYFSRCYGEWIVGPNNNVQLKVRSFNLSTG